MGSLKWHLFGIAYASENEFLAEIRRIGPGLRVLYNMLALLIKKVLIKLAHLIF